MLMIFTLVFLAACGGDTGNTEGVTKEMALSARQVKTAPVSQAQFSLEIRSTGTLEASKKAQVRALASGPVDQVLADIGDQVKKGQPLLQIRKINAQLACNAAEAGLKTAQASLDNLLAWQREERVAMAKADLTRTRAEDERLSRDLERAEAVFEKGAISESQLQAARSAAASARAFRNSAEEALKLAQAGPTREELDIARAQLEQARAQAASAEQSLADTTVKAPFSGVITARFLKVGDYIGHGDPVMDIVDDSYLEAESQIPERYAKLITRGLPVIVHSSSIGLEKTGEVIAVSPAVESSTRTFKIKAGVDNTDSRFNPGIFCTCIFNINSIEGALGVPAAAVQNSEGQTFVWINDNNKARRIIVKPGAGRNGLIHRIEGLNGNEQVVIEGAGALSEGDALEIVQ